jgi:hypothetical protein
MNTSSANLTPKKSNRVLILGLGCLAAPLIGLLLIVALILIVGVENPEFRKRAAAKQLTSYRPVREGKLSAVTDLPPPIVEALAVGSKVWLLRDYRFVDAASHNKYLVLDEYGLDKVITVFQSGDWGEWTKAPPPDDQKIPAYYAFALQLNDSVSVLTEHRKTGFTGLNEIVATQRTTISISPDTRVGSWKAQFESGRNGAIVPEDSQFSDQTGKHSGTVEVLTN